MDKNVYGYKFCYSLKIFIVIDLPHVNGFSLHTFKEAICRQYRPFIRNGTCVLQGHVSQYLLVEEYTLLWKKTLIYFLSFFTIPTTTKHDPLLSVHNQHPLLLPASVSESATTPTISTTISPVSDSTRILYFSIFVSEFRIKLLGFKNQNPSGAGLPGPSIGLQVDPPSTLMLIPLMGFLALVTW